MHPGPPDQLGQSLVTMPSLVIKSGCKSGSLICTSYGRHAAEHARLALKATQRASGSKSSSLMLRTLATQEKGRAAGSGTTEDLPRAEVACAAHRYRRSIGQRLEAAMFTFCY